MFIFDAIFRKSDVAPQLAPSPSKKENPFMVPTSSQDFQSDLLKAINFVMDRFNAPKLGNANITWEPNGVSITVKFPDNNNSGWNSLGEIRKAFVGLVNDQLENMKSEYRIKNTFGDGISNIFNGKNNYSYTYYKP